MKTLRTTLALLTALAATAAFAGPHGKGRAPYRSGPAVAVENKVMIEKSGKRTIAVPCDGSTAKCKAHCAQ